MKKFAGPLHQQQEKVNAYFQSRSSFWKDIYASGGVFAEIIQERHATVLAWIESLALAPESQVLEVGCGAGFMAIALAQRGFRVHAIDSVETMIEQARRQAAEAGVGERLCLEVGDVYNLAFEEESFDLVLAIGVIPWLEQPELAMQEMARVTRPGGHVILTADNRARLNCLLDPWLNPALAPLKRRVKHTLEWLGLHRRSTDEAEATFNNFHDRHFIDEALASTELIKTRGKTLGFGPFSLSRRKVLPEPLATAVHRRLQRLADRNVPGLCSTGAHYIVLARKSQSRSDLQPTSAGQSASDTIKAL